MPKGYDTPQGNVYSPDNFNEQELFPSYMEATHKEWIGFQPPWEEQLVGYFTVDNWETEPAVGVEYQVHQWTDGTYTTETKPINFEYGLIGTGFDYEPLVYPKEGIKVVALRPCEPLAQLVFRYWPKKLVHYYQGLNNITTTMNNVFDVFTQDIDRLNAIRDNFRSMVDIRNLEKLNAS